ncbi:MAG: hypothetical protein OK442_07510 [Thaumarchaeota archaeon]|nr:hypothetical protein [Nitrososphaerota archaeon]
MPDDSSDGDSTPAGQLSGASLALYDGWMTGWSYEACRHLYFMNDDPGSLPPDERLTLLGWLSTYRNLIDAWCPVDAEGTTKELDMMEERAGAASKGHHSGEPITAGSFDSHFEEVKGAIRAKAPYDYYTVLFASYASRLRFPREGDVRPKLVGSLRVFLENMKGVLQPGVFDFIDNDLDEVKDDAEGERDLKQRIQIWSDLVFGTLSVDDALNGSGRALVVLSILGVGLTLFLLVGGIIYGVFKVIQVLPGFSPQALNSLSMSNLSSVIQNLVPAVAALGLSTSLLVTRAWDAVQAFEVWVAVQLARFVRLRRRNVYAMIG